MADDRLPDRNEPPDGTRTLDEARLRADLGALGRALHVPPLDEGAVAASVLTRLEEEPASPLRTRIARVRWSRPVLALQRRRRIVLVALGGALLGLVLATPVGATVADWFGFEGVLVRPGPSVSQGTPPRAATGNRSLEEASALVDFGPVVPRALGAPEAVEVSPDRRLLSMTWHGPTGLIRLDEFDGGLAPVFAKTASRGAAEFVDLGGAYALWFRQPHDVVLLDDHGRERTESARAAGPTLVWESEGVTLRLEGVPDRRRAVEIARSGTR